MTSRKLRETVKKYKIDICDDFLYDGDETVAVATNWSDAECRKLVSVTNKKWAISVVEKLSRFAALLNARFCHLLKANIQSLQTFVALQLVIVQIGDRTIHFWSEVTELTTLWTKSNTGTRKSWYWLVSVRSSSLMISEHAWRERPLWLILKSLSTRAFETRTAAGRDHFAF